METDADPLFKLLFFSTDDAGDDSLDAEVVHPVAKFVEQTQLDRALRKAGTEPQWDEEVSAPLVKSASAEIGSGDFLSAGERHELWKSIVRVERVQDPDGDWWSNGYNAKGQLVDARWITE